MKSRSEITLKLFKESGLSPDLQYDSTQLRCGLKFLDTPLTCPLSPGR